MINLKLSAVIIISLIIGLTFYSSAQKTKTIGGDLSSVYSNIMNSGPKPDVGKVSAKMQKQKYNVLLNSEGKYINYDLTNDVLVNNLNATNLTRKQKLNRAMLGGTMLSRNAANGGYNPNKFMKNIPAGNVSGGYTVKNQTKHIQKINTVMGDYGTPSGTVSNMSATYSKDIYTHEKRNRIVSASGSINRSLSLGSRYDKYSSPYQERPKEDDNQDKQKEQKKTPGKLDKKRKKLLNNIENEQKDLMQLVSNYSQQADKYNQQLDVLLNDFYTTDDDEKRGIIVNNMRKIKSEYNSLESSVRSRQKTMTKSIYSNGYKYKNL